MNVEQRESPDLADSLCRLMHHLTSRTACVGSNPPTDRSCPHLTFVLRGPESRRHVEVIRLPLSDNSVELTLSRSDSKHRSHKLEIRSRANHPISGSCTLI
jgi:hypothetical protein